MRKLNGRRFSDGPRDNFPTSGESPVLWKPLPDPAITPPGRGVSRELIIAQPRHLKFLADLQKKFSNQLGFLPTAALQWYVEQKRVGIAFENGDPAGYVLGRTHFRYQPLMRPITQAAVYMDAQRRQHGLALVNRVCEQAAAAGQRAVQAACAEDLESNAFWRALDFQVIDLQQPDNARGRKIVIWRKPLTDEPPVWFYDPPKCSGQRPRRR